MAALLPHQVPHVGQAEEKEEDDVSPPDDGVAEEVDAVVLAREVLAADVDGPLPGARRVLPLLRLQPRVARQHDDVGLDEPLNKVGRELVEADARDCGLKILCCVTRDKDQA